MNDFTAIAHLCWMPGQGVNGGLVVGEEKAGGRLLLMGSQVEELELAAHVGGHNLRGPGEDDVSEGAAVALLVHLRVHCSVFIHPKNTIQRWSVPISNMRTRHLDFLLHLVSASRQPYKVNLQITKNFSFRLRLWPGISVLRKLYKGFQNFSICTDIF
jgi:hypothetical protein